MIESSSRRQILLWLSTGCFLIFLMVIIGGITRLTGSGLSITDWKLISGTVPPMNDLEWQESFEAYKQFPEYEIQPHGFSLENYKSIFWWEYLHRFLGRLIGVVFIIPFLYFLIKKKIKGKFIGKLLILFALGGLQGFLGWYMVKSGLLESPHVSHYRLAIHLVTAFISFAYTFWLILEILFPKKVHAGSKLRNLTLVFLSLLFIQIVYGAFTAGLKAGLFYNTFPKMGELWIAEGVTAMTPFYLNFLEGIAGVQFIHRYLGIALFLYSVYYLYYAKKNVDDPLRKNAVYNVFIIVSLQVVLGIIALIYSIPLFLALIHQIGAFFLLMSLIYSLRVSNYGIR